MTTQDQMIDRPKTLVDSLDPLMYENQAEQERHIIEAVAQDGYSVQQNDPLMYNWDVPQPAGLEKMHMTHNQAQVLWNPQVGAVKHLIFDVSKGLQSDDEQRLTQLMQQGWGEISSGSASDSGYVNYYLYRPIESKEK